MSDLEYVLGELETWMHQAYDSGEEDAAHTCATAINLLKCMDEDLKDYENEQESTPHLRVQDSGTD